MPVDFLLCPHTEIMPDSSDYPDNPCLSCGACCAHFRVSFYCGELTGGSGGSVPAELASRVSGLLACMRGTELGNGRCVALAGEIGAPGVRCRIYDDRPSTCREFVSWRADGTPNPDCQQVRAVFGLAALPARPPTAR